MARSQSSVDSVSTVADYSVHFFDCRLFGVTRRAHFLELDIEHE